MNCKTCKYLYSTSADQCEFPSDFGVDKLYNAENTPSISFVLTEDVWETMMNNQRYSYWLARGDIDVEKMSFLARRQPRIGVLRDFIIGKPSQLNIDHSCPFHSLARANKTTLSFWEWVKSKIAEA